MTTNCKRRTKGFPAIVCLCGHTANYPESEGQRHGTHPKRPFGRKSEPKNIPLTKSALHKMLRSHEHRLSCALCCALAIGEEHPRFREWLTKACYYLLMIGSFIYIVPYPDGEQTFTRRSASLPLLHQPSGVSQGHGYTGQIRTGSISESRAIGKNGRHLGTAISARCAA